MTCHHLLYPYNNYYNFEIDADVFLYIYIYIGQITQRDHRHPAYYRGRLLHLEQTKIITDVTEESCKDEGTGFICHLSLVVLATQSKRKFQSSKVMLGKAEARESAAEVAVLSLGIVINPRRACAGGLR